MSATIWGVEIELDIGLPDEVIPEFRSRFKRIFGRIAGLWDYPPEVVKPNGDSIYSCLGSEQAGHHVAVSIDYQQRKRFHDFLSRFCKKHGIDLSPFNLSILNS